MRTLLKIILFALYANTVTSDCEKSLFSKIYSEDENFPSVVTIIDNDKKFLCNAVIVGKNEIATDQKCLESKNAEDFLIRFQIPTLTDEKILSPSQISEISRKEEVQFEHFNLLDVTVIYLFEEIDDEFFNFPTLLMKSIMSDRARFDVGNENQGQVKRCRFIESQRLQQAIVKMPFYKKETASSGAFYFQANGNWFLYGLYGQDVKNKIASSEEKSAIDEVKNYFLCFKKSPTKALGTKTKKFFCPGDVLFEDNFEDENFRNNWRFDETLSGGRNWEFMWLSSDPTNSFIEDGKLNLSPTLTSKMEGNNEDFLTSGIARISPTKCTDKRDYGCSREGQYGLINPIRSAGISTINSISFKYGTVEIKAKIASGDWLQSLIRIEPKSNIYNKDLYSPYNGDMSLLEGRGNKNYFDEANKNIGNKQSTCRIQFSKNWKLQFHNKNNDKGFSEDFHIYKMVWTPEEIKMYIDDEITCEIEAPIWENYMENLKEKPDYLSDNPWPSDRSFAPFDQLFYLSISLRCGGVSFFPDGLINTPYEKPWKNDSPKAKEEFWNARSKWESTWIKGQKEFQIDYVKISAI